MKLVSEDQIAAHQAYVVKAGLKGLIAGFAISVPASIILQRRSPTYRGLTTSLKVFGLIGLPIPAFAVCAERASLAFDRAEWSEASKVGLNAQQLEDQKEMMRIQSLSQGERLTDWAKRHQYSLIGGSWAVSMGIASAIVMRNRHQTFSQKIVQARMWAQGLTILVLIAAGILTHKDRQARREMREQAHADHSWADVIAQAEQRKLEEHKS